MESMFPHLLCSAAFTSSPLGLCEQDFHHMLNNYCEGQMGVRHIKKGDFQLIHSVDSGAIKPSELISEAQHGVVFKMSIMLRLAQNLHQRKCPHCHYVSRTVSSNGLIKW